MRSPVTPRLLKALAALDAAEAVLRTAEAERENAPRLPRDPREESTGLRPASRGVRIGAAAGSPSEECK